MTVWSLTHLPGEGCRGAVVVVCGIVQVRLDPSVLCGHLIAGIQRVHHLRSHPDRTKRGIQKGSFRRGAYPRYVIPVTTLPCGTLPHPADRVLCPTCQKGNRHTEHFSGARGKPNPRPGGFLDGRPFIASSDVIVCNFVAFLGLGGRVRGAYRAHFAYVRQYNTDPAEGSQPLTRLTGE
eukprot:1176094-Prorocentrum_minimum.AAC.3